MQNNSFIIIIFSILIPSSGGSVRLVAPDMNWNNEKVPRNKIPMAKSKNCPINIIVIINVIIDVIK